MQVRANGLDVSVDVSGAETGPPVLCLHSLATDRAVWDGVLAELEQRFRVIRPDLRGHGSTSSTPPPYDLELLRDDAVALLDALGVERASVIGLSIGAILALELALHVPERIDRIVVADCRADAPPPYVEMWDGAIAVATAQGLEPVIATSMERWFSAAHRSAHAEELEAFRRRALRTSLDGFVGCARAVQGLALLPRLAQISTPTLYVVGTEDPAAPPAVMREMAARTPGADLVEIVGAGHLTPVEAPGPFAAAVVPFLEA